MPDRSTEAADGPTLGGLLCFAIYSAGHALNRVYKPLLDALGLTYPQYLVMVALWERDDQTVGRLGDRLTLESSTLTPLLKRLEKTGCIRRARDPADERQVRVCLTPQGSALRAKAASIPDCILAASGLRAAQITRLQAEVIALRDALERGASARGAAMAANSERQATSQRPSRFRRNDSRSRDP